MHADPGSVSGLARRHGFFHSSQRGSPRIGPKSGWIRGPADGVFVLCRRAKIQVGPPRSLYIVATSRKTLVSEYVGVKSKPHGCRSLGFSGSAQRLCKQRGCVTGGPHFYRPNLQSESSRPPHQHAWAVICRFSWSRGRVSGPGLACLGPLLFRPLS